MGVATILIIEPIGDEGIDLRVAAGSYRHTLVGSVQPIFFDNWEYQQYLRHNLASL
jgi:hypothetical protein